jgi:hypothetical protein
VLCGKRLRIAVALACAPGLGLLIAIAILSADTRSSGAPQAPVYSPYPAGLFPKDLEAETDRVNREIEDLEQEEGSYAGIFTTVWGTQAFSIR